MSNSEIEKDQEYIKDPTLSSVDHLVDQVTKLNNLLESELIKNLTMLDELRELSKLSSLDNLTKLEELQKLSELSQLNELVKLNKLENLNQLSNLERLESLDKLDLLNNLEVVNKHFENNISKLKELNNLKELEKLSSLDNLDNLTSLENLQSLKSLSKLDGLQELNRLDELQILNKLGDLKEIRRLDPFLQILKERGNELEKLNKLDNLHYLEKLEELSKLDQLRGLDNLKDLTFLERLSALSSLEKLQRLDKLDQLESLTELKRLDELKSLDGLKYLEKLDKLEKMIQDGSLDKLDKLDKIDILNTNKKKIVFSSITSSVFDFIKIGAITTLLTFIVIKSNREDARLSMLQNIALDESSALSITLPLLRNALTVEDFDSLYRKTSSLYKSKIDRFWTPRNITAVKLDNIQSIWSANFEEGKYDLSQEIQDYWEEQKNSAMTYLDDESKKINKDTLSNEKEVIDLKRLKNLIFSKRCDDAYKLSQTFPLKHKWQLYIDTSKLLLLDCLRESKKLPRDI